MKTVLKIVVPVVVTGILVVGYVVVFCDVIGTIT